MDKKSTATSSWHPKPLWLENMKLLHHSPSLLHTSTADERGFTLIEIIFTLAILSFALPTLLRSFTIGARGQAISQNRTTALYLLRFRMAEIELVGYPDIGEDDGEFGENSRFRWHSDVQEVESEELEGLRLATVTVTWQERGKEKSISMNTYFADRQMPQTQSGQQNQGGDR
ncbi:MAG: prepilin-type N-terminal cleavage/methylation domain-containing protein [Candidatus Poribacteria bacterium]|nr:prepilin-type N-terminal cleavage/methylation domain-containing protein [Candidatus Poribacteria bacterium]